MPLVVTDAMVLHAFDYLETSRVLRLVTRDAGLQSVIAKGARRTRGRVGSGVDLFAEGEAQIYVKAGRELNTLAAFDVARSRPELALDLDRFAAASALAEITLKIAGEDSGAALFEAISSVMDAVAAAEGDAIPTVAIAGAWRIVASAGFSPSLDRCAVCGDVTRLDSAEAFAFSHSSGGLLCAKCSRSAAGAVARRLPVTAAAALGNWLRGAESEVLSRSEARAHLRLLREFISEHVAGTDRSLRAFAAWEQSTI